MRTSSLLTMLLLTGCSGAPRATVFTHTAGPRSFLALGDSYTIGEGVQETDRWPVQLVNSLRARGLALDDPVILAKTGWTTSDLQLALADAKLTGPYRLVSLLIGVNDQFRHSTPEQYRHRFVALLNQAVILAGGKSKHVLVLSIPDYDYGPKRKFAPANISESLDGFNAVCREEATRHGVVFVNITDISRQAKDMLELWSGDQLHFAGLMYANWVKAMMPEVEKMVRD